MPPAIALRPVDQLLPVVDQPEWLSLDVSVQPFFDQRLHFASRGVGDADVNAMHVAAGAAEIEFVRRVAQPLRLDLRPARPALLLLLLLLLFLLLVLIAALDSQSSGALPFERRDARGRDRHCL